MYRSQRRTPDHKLPDCLTERHMEKDCKVVKRLSEEYMECMSAHACQKAGDPPFTPFVSLTNQLLR